MCINFKPFVSFFFFLCFVFSCNQSQIKEQQLQNDLYLEYLFSGVEEEENFPIILQKGDMDCGPVCLQMVCEYYGKNVDLDKLKRISKLDDEGTSLFGLSEAADSVGLHNLGVELPYNDIVEAPLPAIAYWEGNHFIVVYKVSKDSIWVADPAIGTVEYSKEEFCQSWSKLDSKDPNSGVLLLIETTDKFYEGISKIQ